MNFPYLRSFGLVLALATVSACASREYSAEPIEIRVVDAETKKPIEGALVIAQWAAKVGLLHSPWTVGSVEILEMITGLDGKIHFSGWGPVRYEGKGALLDEDPRIVIFKRGYRTEYLSNSQYGVPSSKDYRSHTTGPTRTSLWNGEVVQMKPFKGGLKEFATTLYDSLTSHLTSMLSETTTCDWQKMPLSIAYLEHERDFYIENGVMNSCCGPHAIRSHLLSNDANIIAKGCGSPRQFYKESQLRKPGALAGLVRSR